MFQVLDHGEVVFTGGLSQTTQYVIDHYGNTLDGAIRSGVRISYVDPHFGSHEVGETIPGRTVRDFWGPIEDWEID